VAEDSIVGTVALRRVDDRACQLTRLSVHLDYRRHDITQQLETALEEYAREAGFRRITAQSTVRQKPLSVFLESVGFEEFKRTLRDKNVIITYEKAL